jgi:Reverse transcriptase (RNA-dependent DNA polymerase)
VAQVTPFLKKQGLDKSQPSSYRPISNLNTISKVIERLVLGQLKRHVYASGNFNLFQSAFRTGHYNGGYMAVMSRVYNEFFRTV